MHAADEEREADEKHGRRPKRSESGPMAICEIATAARNIERMSCTRP